MNKILKKTLQIIFSLLFWGVIWAGFSYRINNTFLLPSPKETLTALGELLKTCEFWIISLRSFGRIFYGILLAVILGIILAVITSRLSFFEVLITPVMSAVKATPVASFIILAIIWFERNTLPVFITVLIVLPIVWTNISAGVRSINKNLIEVANVYKLGVGKRLTKLYIPSVMPYFLAACRSALGMAWKAGIAAEVLCTPKEAIGTELYLSKTYMEMPTMFAWTVVIILFSLVIEKILIYLITRLSRKLHTNAAEVRV